MIGLVLMWSFVCLTSLLFSAPIHWQEGASWGIEMKLLAGKTSHKHII